MLCSGTGNCTVLVGWTTSLGSNVPARPWASASFQTVNQPLSTSRLCAAAQPSVDHWVWNCCCTRSATADELPFSKVIPAAPKPAAGTVSPYPMKNRS